MKKQYQQGSALLFSLIMLTVVTLLAASTMKTSILDEKIASNTQFTQLAYLEARSEIEAQYQYMVWSDRENISGETTHIADLQVDDPFTLDSRLDDIVGINTVTLTQVGEKSNGAAAGYSMGDSTRLAYYIMEVESNIVSVNASSSQSLGFVRVLPGI